MHAPAPEQATPARPLAVAPFGLGVGTTDQPGPAAAATAPVALTTTTQAATAAAGKAHLMNPTTLSFTGAVPGGGRSPHCGNYAREWNAAAGVSR